MAHAPSSSFAISTLSGRTDKHDSRRLTLPRQTAPGSAAGAATLLATEGTSRSSVVPSTSHLCCVASLDVAERRVGVHDAGVTQVLQRHQVLLLAQPVQVAARGRRGSRRQVSEKRGARDTVGVWRAPSGALPRPGRRAEAAAPEGKCNCSRLVLQALDALRSATPNPGTTASKACCATPAVPARRPPLAAAPSPAPPAATPQRTGGRRPACQSVGRWWPAAPWREAGAAARAPHQSSSCSATPPGPPARSPCLLAAAEGRMPTIRSRKAMATLAPAVGQTVTARLPPLCSSPPLAAWADPPPPL